MLRKYFKKKFVTDFINEPRVRDKIIRVIWWRKRRINRGHRKFEKIYKVFTKVSRATLKGISRYANCCFFYSLPARQHQFTIWQFNPNQHINFSTGKFLNMLKKHVKFYKRDSRSTATLVLQLKKIYGATLKYVYYMRINNYNYRQYNFFMKYMELFKPYIYMFQTKQSFIPRWTTKRRIKRRILRLISN